MNYVRALLKHFIQRFQQSTFTFGVGGLVKTYLYRYYDSLQHGFCCTSTTVQSVVTWGSKVVSAVFCDHGHASASQSYTPKVLF